MENTKIKLYRKNSIIGMYKNRHKKPFSEQIEEGIKNMPNWQVYLAIACAIPLSIGLVIFLNKLIGFS